MNAPSVKSLQFQSGGQIVLDGRGFSSQESATLTTHNVLQISQAGHVVVAIGLTGNYAGETFVLSSGANNATVIIISGAAAEAPRDGRFDMAGVGLSRLDVSEPQNLPINFSLYQA